MPLRLPVANLAIAALGREQYHRGRDTEESPGALTRGGDRCENIDSSDVEETVVDLCDSS